MFSFSGLLIVTFAMEKSGDCMCWEKKSFANTISRKKYSLYSLQNGLHVCLCINCLKCSKRFLLPHRSQC